MAAVGGTQKRKPPAVLEQLAIRSSMSVGKSAETHKRPVRDTGVNWFDSNMHYKHGDVLVLISIYGDCKHAGVLVF